MRHQNDLPNFENRYNMRLRCRKQKPTIQMRLFFAFATFMFTTNLFSQVKPYFAIGVVNDCHFYNGNTGYLGWNQIDTHFRTPYKLFEFLV